MANIPVFIATPKSWLGLVSAANTNRDGTGTLVSLVTGAALGTRIDQIRVTALATTTAGMVRFFVYDGTNTRPWMELAVDAITVSASDEAFTGELVRLDTLPLLVLPVGWILKASTHNAESFGIAVGGGDY